MLKVNKTCSYTVDFVKVKAISFTNYNYAHILNATISVNFSQIIKAGQCAEELCRFLIQRSGTACRMTLKAFKYGFNPSKHPRNHTRVINWEQNASFYCEVFVQKSYFFIS